MKKYIASFFIIILTFCWVLPVGLNAQSTETESSNPPGIADIHEGVMKAVSRAIAEVNQVPALVPATREEAASLQDNTNSDILLSPQQVIESVIKPANKNKTMDLDFADTPLEGILQTVGDAAGINIVLDPVLKGKTLALHIKKVKVPDALNIIADSCGLAYKKVGGSLFVTTKERLHSDTLITRLFKLRNVKASEIKSLVKSIIETVNVSEDTNSLYVLGSMDDIRKVEDLVKKVDVSQPQVVLEAQIIEVNRNAVKNLGVQWSQTISTNFQEAGRPVNFDNVQSSTGSPLKLYSMARSPVSFETTLQMLENDNKAKLLANPRIITLNNQESEIFVGDRIPYTVTIVSGGVITTEVRWVEPGIRLKITPSIINRDFVAIKIEPEVSYIYQFIGPQNQYPWVKTRNATAFARIQNEHTFILGGLLDQEEKKGFFKVPILGSLPFIGKLFSYQTNAVTDEELIITVKPVIIN